ncbi:MAG: hypothetical protein ACK4FL_02100 [Microgenomates group bacterium]
MRRIFSYLILTFLSLISTFILWFKVDMMTVYQHYDGPWYVVVAKTFYDPKQIESLKLETALPEKYFAAHLPGYPIFIKLISLISPFRNLSYLKAMVIVNLLATVGLALFFYWFLKRFKLTKNPLILTSVFLFLPRFLVVRSVGAPESLFILFIILSLYFFEKNIFLLAGLFGGLATLTKTPGVLLFGGYGLVFIEKFIKERKINWQWLGVLLIPLSLLGLFLLYSIQYKDFFAYFNSGDNIHLVYPFSVFNFEKPWVGTAWLEDVLFYYFLYGLTVINLKNVKYRSFFYFSLVFFLAVVFVQHRDISRYSLPLWPMAIISFERFFTSKKFLIIFLIVLPGIFFYAINFLQYNILPISDWRPFL